MELMRQRQWLRTQRYSRGMLFCVLFFCVFTGETFAEGKCERIVSLAPSITETVYELGLGDKLVGVTRYCRYPTEVETKAQVGGYLDLNLEAVVRLKPSIVFLLAEQESVERRLNSLGIPVVRVDHTSLAGFQASVAVLAKSCDVERAAGDLFQRLEQAVKEIQLRPRKGAKQPLRVMVVVGGQVRGGRPSDLYVSGVDGYYSDLLQLIGARNVFDRHTSVFPLVTVEGIHQLAPDIVVHILSVDDASGSAAMRQAWAAVRESPLLKNLRVLVLDQDFATVPGPRYPQLLNLLQRNFYAD